MESQPLGPQEAEKTRDYKVSWLEEAARSAAAFSIPQWISALSSLVVASIAIWALLFSSTSEALVKYLHSELATRNIQIATLEAREQKLQSSVESREKELSLIEQKSSTLVNDLAALADQRDTLQRQVAEIQTERNRLVIHVDEISSNLSKTEFSLIKEKIRAELSGKLVSTLPFNVERRGVAKNAGPKKAEIWTDYFSFIRATADKLPEKDKPLGRQVVTRFVSQCGHLSSVTFPPPPQGPPKRDFVGYFSLSEKDRAKQDAEAEARSTDFSQKNEAWSKQIFAAEDDIIRCLLTVTPS
jgi:hypothetical protein